MAHNRAEHPKKIDAPVEEAVVAIVRAGANWDECRAIAELITRTQRLTPREAHRLLLEQPGALYIIDRGQRLNLLPARDGDQLYVRTLRWDSPTDPLLVVPVHTGD